MIEAGVACGAYYTIVLKTDGTVWGCGLNTSGQLGTGDTANKLELVKVEIKSVKKIYCGGSHTVFIKKDGTIWGCGNNAYGQLGVGDKENRNIPIKIDMTDVEQVACGTGHTLFLKKDGTVWGCGLNTSGQLGIGNNVNQINSVKVEIEDVREVVCGGTHTIFIKEDGTAWSCGNNTYGTLGRYSNNNLILGKVALDNVKKAAANELHTMFLKTDGTVWGCGHNFDGMIGDGSSGQYADKTIPSKAKIENVKQISCGYGHTIFIKNDETVWGCGRNIAGILGNGAGIGSTMPNPVKGILEEIKQVGCGTNHTIYIKNNNELWACGFGDKGQLGSGTTSGHYTPVLISNLSVPTFYMIKDKGLYKTIKDKTMEILEIEKITQEIMKEQGFSDLGELKEVYGQFRSSFEIINYDNENQLSEVHVGHIPDKQIIILKNDISLLKYSNIKQMTFTTTGAAGSVRVVFSFDRGKTWNTFIEGAWKGITLSIDSVQADGITPEALSAIPPEKWNEMNTGTLRIACCLSKAAVTDDMAVDVLTITGDTTSWERAGHMTEYDYEYPNTTTLVVHLLSDGSYKINRME